MTRAPIGFEREKRMGLEILDHLDPIVGDRCPRETPILQGREGEARFLLVDRKTRACPYCGPRKRRDDYDNYRPCLGERAFLTYVEPARWDALYKHLNRRNYADYIRVPQKDGRKAVLAEVEVPDSIEVDVTERFQVILAGAATSEANISSRRAGAASQRSNGGAMLDDGDEGWRRLDYTGTVREVLERSEELGLYDSSQPTGPLIRLRLPPTGSREYWVWMLQAGISDPKAPRGKPLPRPAIPTLRQAS